MDQSKYNCIVGLYLKSWVVGLLSCSLGLVLFDFSCNLTQFSQFNSIIVILVTKNSKSLLENIIIIIISLLRNTNSTLRGEGHSAA